MAMAITFVKTVLGGFAETHPRVKSSLLEESGGSHVFVGARIQRLSGTCPWAANASSEGRRAVLACGQVRPRLQAASQKRIPVLRVFCEGGQRCETSPPLQCVFALFEGMKK